METGHGCGDCLLAFITRKWVPLLNDVWMLHDLVLVVTTVALKAHLQEQLGFSPLMKSCLVFNSSTKDSISWLGCCYWTCVAALSWRLLKTTVPHEHTRLSYRRIVQFSCNVHTLFLMKMAEWPTLILSHFWAKPCLSIMRHAYHVGLSYFCIIMVVILRTTRKTWPNKNSLACTWAGQLHP